MSEYEVEVLPVLDTMVVQVLPPLVDRWIMYPVIDEPPLLDGAVHARLIWSEETVVAVSPVGEDGAVTPQLYMEVNVRVPVVAVIVLGLLVTPSDQELNTQFP